MNSFFLNIVWNTPDSIDLGFIKIHFYSIMFVATFFLGTVLMKKIYQREGKSEADLDKLVLYVVLATLIGARLGHVFFYDWAYFKNHPAEILLPFRFNPQFEFTGFRGLASHGAAIGIIVSMIYYSRKVIKENVLWILDRIVIPVSIGGMFVRFGNFFNSEIYGHASSKNNPLAVKFVRESEFWKDNNIFVITKTNNIEEAYKQITHNPEFQDILNQIPFRHPAQMYEAAGYFVLFWALLFLYWKTDARHYTGKIFGIFLVALWSIRFAVEYVKESQGGFESELGLFSTGQWLSIPFIIAGIYFWLSAKKQEN